MTDPDAARLVDAHYSPDDLGGRILSALRAAGKDPATLAPDDLTPFDQFHTGGRDATLALGRLVGIQPGTDVLDIGGGLGGPARTLASAFDCKVTVLDLTESFCRVGEDLTRRVGLADRVRFRHGDALAMPFADGSFDAVWTQHSSMNIPDKIVLYAEAHRVLRPGGRLALHEIMAGPVQPVHFPVPWARDPAISFLRPADEVRAALAAAGFVEAAWLDMNESAMAWYRRMAAPPADPDRPPLGLHLLLGADLPAMGRNLARNLEEGRITVVQAVFDRP